MATISFFGTDDLAVTVLARLLSDPQFEVVDVVVPPKVVCPVKVFAHAKGLPVFEDPEKVLRHPVDFVVVAVYGKILSENLLSHARYGAVNVHPSLLPKYRGPSPIRSALLHGDSVTGVSIMKMEPTLDTGPVYAFSEFVIHPHHHAESLRDDLAKLAAEMLAQTLPGIASGSIDALPQDDSRASYCPKFSRESGEVLWGLDSALEIERKWKAYYPWPGLYTQFKGKRIKILKGHAKEGPVQQWGLVHREHDVVWVDAKEGRFVLEQLQLEGKKPTGIADFLRGYGDFKGAVLGDKVF